MTDNIIFIPLVISNIVWFTLYYSVLYTQDLRKSWELTKKYDDDTYLKTIYQRKRKFAPYIT